MSVTVPSHFDITRLSPSEIKRLTNGSQTVYLNYNGGKLRLQTPQMAIPYDAGDYKSPGADKGDGNFKVSLSFRDRSSIPAIKNLYDVIERIDNFVLDKMTENAGKWLGMPGATRENLRFLYTPGIRISKEKSTGLPRTDVPPTLSGALKQNNGSFTTEIYDKDLRRSKVGDRMATPLETLVRGTEATFQLDLMAIWIAGGKFGVSWRVHSAWINKPGASASSGPGFVSEDGVPLVVASGGAGGPAVVSSSEESALLATMLPTAAAAAPAATAEEEGEEEAEEEEEEAEEEGEDEAEEAVEAPPVPPIKTKAPVVAAPAPVPVVAVAAAPAVAAATAAKKPITKKVKTVASA
jgi:hypothetical protein